MKIAQMEVAPLDHMGSDSAATRELNYAWGAGLLEGEGCFSIHKRSNRRNSYDCAIHCEMSDEDVVRKLRTVMGVGTVNLRLNKSGRRSDSIRKPTWIWSVQNKTDVLEVLLRVMPFLGDRRLAKAKQLLANIEERGYANK